VQRTCGRGTGWPIEKLTCQFDGSTTLSYLDASKQNRVGKDPNEQVADGKFHGWMSLLLS
jgi:hypothetical protein